MSTGGMRPLVYCMSITPFGKNGAIDEGALRAHLGRLIAANNGIYLGSPGSGEGYSLAAAELRTLYRIGVEEAAGKVPIHANIREGRSADDVLADIRIAIDAGVSLVQIYQLDPGHGMVPTYGEQEAYYREVLDAVDHPVAIAIHRYGYHVPPSLVSKLVREYPQIQVVDIGGLANSYFLELRNGLPGHIRFYTRTFNTFESLAMGSSGLILAENNVIPRTCERIVAGYAGGDLNMMTAAVRALEDFRNVVSPWVSGNARWIKAALRVLGLPGGESIIRKPYQLLSEKEHAALADAFRALDVTKLEELEAPRRV